MGEIGSWAGKEREGKMQEGLHGTGAAAAPRTPWQPTRGRQAAAWACHGARAAGPVSCRIARGLRTSSIAYSGVVFAALDGTDPLDSSAGCQGSSIRVPSGWILAPDNAVSQGVIRAYPWGTLVVVVANGNAYDSAGGYKPNLCSLRILIECNS